MSLSDNSIIIKKDGKVELASVLSLLVANGVPAVFARAIVLNLDKNNDGLISEEELNDSPLCKEKIDGETGDERLKSIFDSIDVNKNGFIEKEELKTLSEKLEPDLRDSLCKCLHDELDKMDTNEDGKVSLDEFMTAAKKITV